MQPQIGPTKRALNRGPTYFCSCRACAQNTAGSGGRERSVDHYRTKVREKQHKKNHGCGYQYMTNKWHHEQYPSYILPLDLKIHYETIQEYIK